MAEINLEISEYVRLCMKEARLFEGENGRYWGRRKRNKGDKCLLQLDLSSQEKIICEGREYFQRFGRSGIIIEIQES